MSRLVNFNVAATPPSVGSEGLDVALCELHCGRDSFGSEKGVLAVVALVKSPCGRDITRSPCMPSQSSRSKNSDVIATSLISPAGSGRCGARWVMPHRSPKASAGRKVVEWKTPDDHT